MVLELIRDQGGFREVRNEYGSRIGGNEGIDVSKNTQMVVCSSISIIVFFLFGVIAFFNIVFSFFLPLLSLVYNLFCILLPYLI